MSSERPKRQYIRGPNFVRFEGLYCMLKSQRNPSSTMRGMLVSHGFVDLYRIITIDHGFDQALFNELSENERDFMKFLLKKCKIESRDFDSAYNKTIHPTVDRLNMIESAMKIGNDSPELKKEYTDLLRKLYEKNVFSYQLYYQMKRSIGRASKV
jgi:hypothetical protein